MISFNPRLSVKKLLVKRATHTVYEADFHLGLNIIRGENSSGKSTILDFLFYGLGGDLQDWREAALLCSEVFIEVSLNGNTAVLAREISESSMRPMRIYPGSFEDSQTSPMDWGLYPYSRSDSKESFSQVLFRFLGMPEATGDESNNITMNQLLRLLYADQLSPVDRIFRFLRFDKPLTRQTVGDLLCGAYDNGLYRQQLRLRSADDELKDANRLYQNAIAAFGNAEHSITIEWVDTERRKLHAELKAVHDEASKLEQRIFNAEVSDGLTLEQQAGAYEALVKAQENVSKYKSDLDGLQLEIADSDVYIEALKTKLSQLHDAASTADYLKAIKFIYCPSCLAPVDETVGEHACSLCKSPFDQERTQARILALINDVGLQLKQSVSLQSDRKNEAQELDIRLNEANNVWSGLAEKYRLLNRLPSTELRTKARELYGRAGYLERQIEDLGQKSSLIERISALAETRRTLNAEIVALKDKIEAGERGQSAQLRKAYSLISSNTIEFLHNDLERQDTFSKATSIQFSFGDDRLSVNGESFFSASSMVYLRNSFFAGFFKSSLEDKSFRHPRFLMLDTIEDKGMEPKRSHHFQDLLAKMSEESNTEHQLIYATAMISPNLSDSKYLVGRPYTHDRRTLDLI